MIEELPSGQKKGGGDSCREKAEGSSSGLAAASG